MNFHLLFLFLIVVSFSSPAVILWSTPTTTIVFPSGTSTIYSVYYNSNQGGIAGKGVAWITSSKTTSPTKYQNIFYATCTGSSNLTITAASYFYAYLNGAYIGAGYNRSKAYVFPIKMTCGGHNLTVIVYTYSNVKQGLTFAITQDQSKCFNCQASGFWNQASCSCSCISPACTCKAPRVWKGYPVCGCGCPVPRFLAETPPSTPQNPTDRTANGTASKTKAFGNATNPPGAAAANRTQSLPPAPKTSESQHATNTASLYASCPYRHYWDQAECFCMEYVYWSTNTYYLQSSQLSQSCF